LKHPRLGATLGLVEELGELVKEVMELEIYQQAAAREKLADEVGDVLFSLFEVCTAYGLSLEEAYEQKIEKIRSKRPDWIAKYSRGLREIRAKLD
jgi:NTP pyrophosphatase (non-canonical NTP hydrolase)